MESFPLEKPRKQTPPDAAAISLHNRRVSSVPNAFSAASGTALALAFAFTSALSGEVSAFGHVISPPFPESSTNSAGPCTESAESSRFPSESSTSARKCVAFGSENAVALPPEKLFPIDSPSLLSRRSSRRDECRLGPDISEPMFCFLSSFRPPLFFPRTLALSLCISYPHNIFFCKHLSTFGLILFLYS